MYAARALLFRRKLEAGEPNPSTKGVVCRYGPGGLLDLTPANLRAEPAKERHARSGYETGWAVEWRLKLLAEGGDPDTLKEADAEAAE